MDDIIYRLDKEKGRQYMEFFTDPSNEWWIIVRWVDKKSNKEIRRNTIIRKDIPVWIQYLTGNHKWEITQINNS